jgi:exodeoxyribonuclease V alpha subunit
VLVGDPGQLASIEAGAVLGDIVGPAAEGLRVRTGTRERLTEVTGRLIDAAEPPEQASIADGIVVLDRVHRFGVGIGRLAAAIRRGDADATIALLSDPPADVRWIPVDAAGVGGVGFREALSPVRDAAVASAAAVVQAAQAGRARAAIEALGGFRILCAHRRGPQGVATWTARIESWLEAEVDGFTAEDPWYIGRPLLVTENDYELRLFNGDSGVIVRGAAGGGSDHVTAAFERRGEVVEFSPARLGAVQTVYAMTIHKSQGSQFDTIAVLLPAPSSPILTRELLYTAVTRARRRVVLAGTEETVRSAVGRPVARASGLRDRLWGI